MAPTPVSFASVALSKKIFLFYATSDDTIGFLQGPGAEANTNSDTTYDNATKIKVTIGDELDPPKIATGCKQLGAVGYNETQIRLYYVAKNPTDGDTATVLKELYSDDLGKTWGYGKLGRAKKGEIMGAASRSPLNATYIEETKELRLYYLNSANNELSVAYMPKTEVGHADDWHNNSNLYPAIGPW